MSNPTKNLFCTVLTYPAPSSNYRGESEENRTVLQKIHKNGKDYAIVSSESIRNALRETLSKKIDPKSIGVGQYQHDVDQKLLKKKLDETVVSCVNYVGVDLNTASKELLSYVSGISPAIAKNIVEWRNKNVAARANNPKVR